MNVYADKKWLKIEPLNFKLTDIEEKYLKYLLLPLIDLAPSSSSFYLEYEKSPSSYRAKLSVISPDRRFTTTSYGKRLYPLTDILKTDMLRQFESWKSHRHFEDQGMAI